MVKKARLIKTQKREVSALEALEENYASMKRILSSSSHLIESLHPMWFQYQNAKDHLLNYTFHKESRPRELLILSLEDGRRGIGEMHRAMAEGYYREESVELDVSSFFAHNGNKKENEDLLFFGNQEEESLTYLPEEIKERIEPIENFALFSNGTIFILALNYSYSVSLFQCEILKGISLQLLLYQTLYLQTKEIREAFIYTASALARAAEAKDVETGHHIKRVSLYSALLAKRLSFNKQELEEISYASKMHDVGKINISHTILLKPGPLTREEFMEMENHTVYGVLILGDSPYLEMARAIALSHHERWDGTGYPYQIKREEIPPEACIVSLADVYDALRSSRPYKPPFDHDKACRIILEGDGRVEPTHFHPQVLEIFRKLHETFATIFEELS